MDDSLPHFVEASLRPPTLGVKSLMDLEQAALLIDWHIGQNRLRHFRYVWQAAVSCCPNWCQCAEGGLDALAVRQPYLAEAFCRA